MALRDTCRDTWLGLVDRVLRPARPEIERCAAQGETYRTGRRILAEERARKIADCEARIVRARAAVVAANDGVISWLMWDLEREWRALSRLDPDGDLMDLWATMAPPSWLDRKLWRDSDRGDQLEAAVALASDVEGVMAAEAAALGLCSSLAAWGARVGGRVRWRLLDRDADCVTEMLAAPLSAARSAITGSDAEPIIHERSQELGRAVHDAASARLAGRPLLSRSLAHAALVESTMSAANISGPSSPVPSLRALWATGYAVTSVDESGVTLEIPRLNPAGPWPAGP